MRYLTELVTVTLPRFVYVAMVFIILMSALRGLMTIVDMSKL